MNFEQMIKQLSGAAERFKVQLPYLPKAFGLVHRAAGGLTIVWLALLLIQGLLPVAYGLSDENAGGRHRQK